MPTLEETTKILGGLAVLYPQIKLVPEMIKAYHKILADIPQPILDKAAMQVASEDTFFPSVSRLRKASFELMAQAEGVPSPEDAWSEVVLAFRSVGSYNDPEWSTPLIGEAVLAMGGWSELCKSENGVADRAHFFKIYQAIRDRKQAHKRMLPAVRRLVKQLEAGQHRLLEEGDEHRE